MKLIDHQLLGVHHVRDDLGAPLSWDIGFLVFGVILIGAGYVALPPRFEEAGGLREMTRLSSGALVFDRVAVGHGA